MSETRGRTRRHPAEVTADRLGDHLDKWEADGRVRDAIGLVRDWLDRIADGEISRPRRHGGVR